MSTNGCGFCGYAGGDCMAPGPDCQLAKKMLKPIPHPTPVYYSEKVEPLPPEGPAAEGVWVSYGLNDDDVMYGFAVHRNELEALRVAVDGGFKARFLNYDDVL